MNRLFRNLYKLSSKSLGPRSSQVFSEKVETPPESDYEVARIVVQKHLADRAKEHFDTRIIIGKSNRAISFASRKLPLEVGYPRLFVQTPDHSILAATFTGDIKEGYGRGRVDVIHDVPAIVRSHGKKLDLAIHRGPLRGNYTLIEKGPKHQWLAIKNKPADHYWEPRPKYGKAGIDLLQHSEYIAEKKIDGFYVTAKLDSKRGISLAAREKSAMGEIEGKEQHVPWIKHIKVPMKYDGVVVRGELFHDTQPLRTVASILLADPSTAVEAQKKIGRLKLAAFDLVKGPKGKEISGLSYNQKRDILKSLVTDTGHELLTVPESSYDKEGLHRKAKREHWEGLVLKHIMTGEPHKLKRYEDLDLKISGMNPGSGRLVGKGIGSFKLTDKHGRYVGDLGSGLSDTVRQDALNSPEKYMHKIVKVQAHEVTSGGKLREPRFRGFSDKLIPDEITLEKTAFVKAPHSQKEKLINKQPVDIPEPLPGVKVYSVDGHTVRTLFDSDYSQGGNGFRYHWIPRNEIWIEQNIVDEASSDELQDTVLHESDEMQHMSKGESYNQAHDEAKHLEDKLRKAQLAKSASGQPDSQITARGVLDTDDEQEEREEDKKQRVKMDRIDPWIGKAAARLLEELWS